MFKTKKNLRRNPKNKGHKNTKQSSQYVEDYNEVILNDLLQDNKPDNEENIQEEPRTKKKKSINFNLGTKKKSNSNDNKKTKNSNKKYKSNNDDPKEILDVETKKDKTTTESQFNENKPTKTQKKSNKLSKKKSKNQPSEESSKELNKKKTKKLSKSVKEDKKTSKKSRKEDELKIKSLEDLDVEVIEKENFEDTLAEGSVFRSVEQNKEIVNEKDELEDKKDQISEHKFEDIIWSDDKFPKN